LRPCGFPVAGNTLSRPRLYPFGPPVFGYTASTGRKRWRDFNPLVCCAARRTAKRPSIQDAGPLCSLASPTYLLCLSGLSIRLLFELPDHRLQEPERLDLEVVVGFDDLDDRVRRRVVGFAGRVPYRVDRCQGHLIVVDDI